MLERNTFSLSGLESIVFLGASPAIPSLIECGDAFGLRSFVITAPDQAHVFAGTAVNAQLFTALNDQFRAYIAEICNPAKTLFVSLGARWIFKRLDIQGTFAGNLVNFHGSRLPLDAGGGGFSWRIMRNDRINNLLVHIIDEGIDTGPVIFSKQVLFPSHCKKPIDYEREYHSQLPDFYNAFIDKILQGEPLMLQSQPNYLGSYYPRLSTDIHGWIDWSWSTENIVKLIDAFDEPYQGASTLLNGVRVYIKSAHLHGGECGNHPLMAGIVLRHDRDWLVVGTSDDQCVLIESVTNDTGQELLPEISVGDRFFSPAALLEKANTTRVRYSAKGIKALALE